MNRPAGCGLTRIILSGVQDSCVTCSLDAHLAAISQINSGIKDDLIARLDTAVDLDLLPEVAHHRHLAQMHHAVLDHRDLQPALR